jgi:predicted DNA-binding transcriptional regulator YafY
MNRIDRLLGILTLLQSKKYVTADKIADKFHISVRTVYRDVKSLCEQGFPVSFEPHKGYFVVQGFFLPPVAFSTEEANALLLMNALVQGFADKSIQTHYTSALNKVQAVLRSSQKEKIDNLSQHIKWQMPPCFNTNYEYLMVIQNAISAKSLLDVEYKGNNNETSQRRVEPIGLIFYALNWHLIAWCHKRNDYRDFRVSRIASLRSTELPFKKDQHIELAEYMKTLPVNY